MDKSEKYLKVKMTTYFSLKEIEGLEYKDNGNDDYKGFYLNGKKIIPDMQYFFEKSGKDVKGLYTEYSVIKEEVFVTKENLEKEHPDYKIMEEMIDEINSKKTD